MAIPIPEATLGASFTNEITGITYTYDGQKWVVEGGGDSHDHDEYVSKSGDTMSAGLKIMTEEGDGAGYGLGIGRRSNGYPMLNLHTDGRIDCWQESFADQHLVTKKFVDDTISAIRQPEILASADLEWKVLTNVDSEDPPEGFAYANGDSFSTISTFRFNVKPFNRPTLPFGGANTGSQLTMYSRPSGTNASGMLLSCYLFLSTSSTPYWKWIGTAEVERAILTDKQIKVELRSSSHRWGTAGMTPSLGYRFTLSSLF